MGDRSVPAAAVNPPRQSSPTARLARAGFSDAADALATFDRWSDEGVAIDERTRVVERIGDAADPDLALQVLDSLPALTRQQVISDDGDLAAVIAVAGASRALGEVLTLHPDEAVGLGHRQPLGAEQMRVQLLVAVGAHPQDQEPVARGASVLVLDALRVAYRAALMPVAVNDLLRGDPVDDTSARLADLADAALAAGLAIARADLPDDSEPCRFSVIAMGKCGAQELNYISDVDVIFIAEAVQGGDEVAALRTATKLATGLIRACGESTSEGCLWEVDAALRPEGKAGALVRTLSSHVGYYERWASTWEFQALLKARLAAGDEDLGRAYVDETREFVWSAANRPDFVVDVQRMRQRVENNVPSKDAARQLKLGRGGLRDVEFSVQLLQLVHGRSDVMVRSPATLSALEALSTWGYVGREDGSVLAAAYRFLRTLEHRIQIYELRRTHLVPEAEADLRRLGRSMGFRKDPVGELTDEWNRHRREVRRIHEKLFYRPLLQAVARLDAGAARLTLAAAEERLQALGYRDPAGALRHLEALTSGVSRRAAIQRTLLPVLLDWFGDGPDPDAGLLGFRRMSDDLGATPWYLRLLRDESLAAERMARVLSSSRYVSDLLLRSPDAVSMLASDSELTPRPLASLMTEVSSALSRHDDADTAAGALRAMRRRELFRLSAADTLGLSDTQEVMAGLSDVTEAALAAALQVAVSSVEATIEGSLPTRFAIVGMGRFGGRELGFGSDADVMFVHDPLPGASEKEAADAALAVANELRRLLSAPSPDPPLEIDADLRPEGRQGPLVRSLASYAAYYDRWSSPWESQALLRARMVAGDARLKSDFCALIDPLRWPARGIDEDSLREMRRLKARMESERMPRGADPTLHTKLGRGGLSDVEWVAQLMQIRHAAQVEQLRTTSTLSALEAGVCAGLLSEEDHLILRSAWLAATRMRNAIVLVRGKAGDVVPSAPPDLTGVAFLLGYQPGHGSDLIEDYRRTTRRARGVVERLFYEYA